MVKHYCDRCGKETKSFNTIKIPKEKQEGYMDAFFSEHLELCEQCENEAMEIYDIIADIKLSMFSKYLKKGGK